MNVKGSKGFTLLELIVSMALIAILLLFSVPHLYSLREEHETKALAQALLSAIRAAQNASVSSNHSVILCSSDDRCQCQTSWRHEAIIFFAEGSDATIHDPVQILTTLHWRFSGKLFWRAAWRHPYLQFEPSGLTKANNGTFWYCAKHAPHPSWAIFVSQAGRARLVYPGNAGKILDAAGREFRCN